MRFSPHFPSKQNDTLLGGVTPGNAGMPSAERMANLFAKQYSTGKHGKGSNFRLWDFDRKDFTPKRDA
jgi:hypothetical protein